MKTVLKTIALGLCATAVWAQTQPGGWRRFDGPGADPQQGPGPAYSQQAPQNYPPPNYQPPPPPPAEVTLPAGTRVMIRVNEALSSDHSQQGQPFTATLAQPVIAQGIVIARPGQTLSGRVAEALKAGRIKGTSSLSVELDELGLVDGQQVPVKTELVHYAGPTSVGQDATAIGATTGIGAAIGAAADGGFGAGMGAIAGAGASIIGVLATRGHQTVISPEDMLTFRTTAPITVSTTSAPQAFLPATPRDYNPGPTLQPRPAYARGPGYPPPAYYPAPYPYYGPYGYPYYYGPSVGVVIRGGHRW